MERYWKVHVKAPNTTPEHSEPTTEQQDGGNSIATEYNCLQQSHLLPDNQDNGWVAELCQYLEDFTQNVSKDTSTCTALLGAASHHRVVLHLPSTACGPSLPCPSCPLADLSSSPFSLC